MLLTRVVLDRGTHCSVIIVALIYSGAPILRPPRDKPINVVLSLLWSYPSSRPLWFNGLVEDCHAPIASGVSWVK